MKKLLFLALALMAGNALAVNKCVIDGKTIYQAAPCDLESQGGEIKLKVSDSEIQRSIVAKKQLDDKMAAAAKAKAEVKADLEKARLDALNTAGITARAKLDAVAADYILNDNSLAEMSKAAMRLHMMSGK